MLEGRADDEKKRNTVPQRHCFAERAGQRSRYLRVRCVAEFSDLRVDERSYGKLIARHHSGYCGSCDVVGECHIQFDAARWREMQ
jgi:hypothetical protein